MTEYEGIKIIYEDNHLLVVEKPVNMPAQPDASGDPDLLTRLKAYLKEKYNKPGNVFLGLVHRLDRPTAGLMVFAKTSKAASRLSDQLRKKMIGKIYLAVAAGQVPPLGHLVHYLVKDNDENKVRIVPQSEPGAKRAELTYQTIEQSRGFSLIRVDLQTGRSHQIRIQFAGEGFPLYGDRKYYSTMSNGNLGLYASELSFEHPTRKELMRFKRFPPASVPWTLFDYLNEERKAHSGL